MLLIMIILGILVVLFFVIGIAFLFKSQGDAAGQEAATKEMDVIRGQEEALKQQLEKMTVDLKETQGKLVKAQEAEEEVAYLRVMEKEEDEKIKKFDEQLVGLKKKAEEQASGACEVISHLEGQNNVLKENLSRLKGKADELAQGSLSAIEALKQQIKDLQEKSAQFSQRPDTDEFGRLKTENQALHTEVEKLFAQVRDFEQQLAAGKNTSGPELVQARDTIAQLSDEGNRLKATLAQMTAKIEGANAEFLTVKESYEQQLAETREALDHLTEEKNQLEKQTVSADQFNDLAAELYKVREERDRLGAESAKRIAQYEADIRVLRGAMDANQARMAELEMRLSSRQEELSKQEVFAGTAGQSVGQGAADGVTVNALIQEKKILEQSLAQLRQANQNLIEQEKIIFAELARVKMKSLGLEKICEGMQERLADGE
jgi:DNA repair exonuclease SbcCD ATPase subunit